jgi:hypothetical protein
MVYDMVSRTAKLYGSAEAVGRCAGEMQLVLEGRTTAGPNAATTDRKERRAKAKVKAKTLAEGRKEGAAFAAPPTSPDSQSSEEEREAGSYPEPNASADSEPSGSQQGTEDEDAEATQAAPRDPMQAADEGAEDVGAEEEQALALALGKRTKALGDLMQALAQGIKVGKKLAADDHDQSSEDTKEAGETGDEKQEAEEKDGGVKGQAAPTTTAESDGDDARPFSPPPVDRTHHSPRGKRRMSDEDERKEAKQPKSPGKEDVQQAEQHGNGGEGGDEMETEIPQLRLDMTQEQMRQWQDTMRVYMTRIINGKRRREEGRDASAVVGH